VLCLAVAKVGQILTGSSDVVCVEHHAAAFNFLSAGAINQTRPLPSFS
jgi:hypothetical protein